jgi:PEP-CTERM motif
MKLKQLAAATALAVSALGSAQAAQLLDPTIYTNWNMESFDAIDPYVVVPIFTPPFSFSSLTLPGHSAPSVSVSVSASLFAQVGVIPSYELVGNGLWGAGNGFVGTDFQLTPTGSVTFTFSQGVRTVGAIVNSLQQWAVEPDPVTGLGGVLAAPSNLTVAVYGQTGTLLEQFQVTPDTDPLGYNEGVFAGFTRPNADIYSFAVVDGKFVIDDLRWAVAPVPEPGEYAMLLVGLGMIGLMAKRRRRSA